jgi:hypothetical protein
LGHLGFIIFATLFPVHFRPELTATEPALVVAFDGIGAFAVLGLLFSGGYPRRYGLVCVIVLGSAILLECLQILVPDRDARMVDVLKRSRAAEPESLLPNGSFRSCQHLGGVPEQPMQDDEVHPRYPVASIGWLAC